jgi:hypothetical protein
MARKRRYRMYIMLKKREHGDHVLGPELVITKLHDVQGIPWDIR